MSLNDANQVEMPTQRAAQSVQPGVMHLEAIDW